jgi:hypothetical protein
MAALDLAPRWLGKHTLFRAPLGGVMRRIGGIPVRRHGGGASGREGSVAMVVDEFRRADAMLLALSPEGTRRRVGRWKSGYFVIAEAAGVPIVPCWFDWERRVVGFGPPVWPADGLDVGGGAPARALPRADGAAHGDVLRTCRAGGGPCAAENDRAVPATRGPRSASPARQSRVTRTALLVVAARVGLAVARPRPLAVPAPGDPAVSPRA